MGRAGVVLFFVATVARAQAPGWACASAEELSAKPPPSKPFLQPDDHTRRAEYLRQAFLWVELEGGARCTGVALGHRVVVCGRARSFLLPSGAITAGGDCSQPLQRFGTRPPGMGGLEPAPARGPFGDGPAIPPVLRAVWLEASGLRTLDARVVAEPGGETIGLEGALPIGAALLDAEDRLVGTVVRHHRPLGLSIGLVNADDVPRDGDPYRELFPRRAQSKSFEDRVRIVSRGKTRLGVGVVLGQAAKGEPVMVLPNEVSRACHESPCTLLNLRGAPTGERLSPRERPDGNPFVLWFVKGAKAPALTPLEYEGRLEVFEPIAVYMPDGRVLTGRIGRGTGELHSEVELDFGEHVFAGVVFNLRTGRFIGFASARGAGEITALDRVGWVWLQLTGFP